MKRVFATVVGLVFFVWGVITLLAGVQSGEPSWFVIGLVIAGFGSLFFPAIASVWAGALPSATRRPRARAASH